jgi:D-alanyl-D-alanine carboxypeptidase
MPSSTPAGSGSAAPLGVDDLTSRLEDVRAAEKLPALGAAVWRSGKLIAQGMTGVRKAGDPARATLDDHWHLGSDTKAMTATLVGLYVDRGVLHWDDTLAGLFPQVPVDPSYAGVTIDQLLAHRGGAPADPGAANAALVGNDPVAARQLFVSSVLKLPVAQAVGTFAYSNAGYVILGTILERAAHKPWEKLIVDDLFTPLGMTGCGFGPPRGAQPWGHRAGIAIDPTSAGADNPPAIGPAGTVHCSLADWGKFLTLHAARRQTLLATSTFEHLHTGDEYMAGWALQSPGPGFTVLAHDGSNTLWYAIAIVVPPLELAFAVVTNQADETLDHAIGPVLKPYIAQAASAARSQP